MVATMDPVVVAFHGYAGNTRILEGLEGFDGEGEGLRQDLPGVKQIASDQHEIDPLSKGVGDDPVEAAEKIPETFLFSGAVAVGFAEMDIGGVNETHGNSL
jgi:hypothetical protein